MSFDELYIINAIEPFSGKCRDVHKSILGKTCRLSELECGQSAILSISDSGEKVRQIITSRIESVSTDSCKSSIRISP